MVDQKSQKVFICFAAEDRYKIAESIVYHLKNYGIDVWYDRYSLLMGDDRVKKNLEEGASACPYAVIILSKDTADSACAMEEIAILHKRYSEKGVTIFPILYELNPKDICPNLEWIRSLIYKEVAQDTGTREVCNHIACKITGDFLQTCRYRCITDAINDRDVLLSSSIYALLISYQKVACENLDSRISLLYAIYLEIIHTQVIPITPAITIATKIFERLFSETCLHLSVDYRELWLLENAVCILIDYYLSLCTEPKI